MRVLSKAVAMAAAAAAMVALALPASATPPQELHLSGDLHTHDPALVAGGHGDRWYVFSTGNGAVGDGNIQIRMSPSGHHWFNLGTVWDTKPAWLTEAVPAVDNLWAPDIHHHDGTWYLYYSASTFGSNRSVIALATNTTLDPHDPQYKWVDRGAVVASTPDDDFNAIDPAVVEDASGTPWMAFGSFWSGIRMVKLAWPSGKRADDATPLRLADRHVPPNAIEGAAVVAHDGMYYLFVSRDFCCRGVDSTYNVAVGRSDSVTGPYVDRNGVSMLANGGTQVLSTHRPVIGPGGESISNGYIAYHYYDGNNNGDFRLAIQKIRWDAAGWPVLQQ